MKIEAVDEFPDDVAERKFAKWKDVVRRAVAGEIIKITPDTTSCDNVARMVRTAARAQGVKLRVRVFEAAVYVAAQRDDEARE